MRIEFLCGRDDAPADQALLLPGCRTLSAVNLRGTGFVGRDWTEEELTGTIDGSELRPGEIRWP